MGNWDWFAYDADNLEVVIRYVIRGFFSKGYGSFLTVPANAVLRAV